VTTPEKVRARASALITKLLAGTRYESRALELLSNEECVVVGSELGTVVYEPIAGAADVIKLHMIVGDMFDRLPLARLVVAEMPDDAPFAEMTMALVAKGFREEGRIEDFVADGIALRILTKRLA
jgi:hypothetical protein